MIHVIFNVILIWNKGQCGNFASYIFKISTSFFIHQPDSGSPYLLWCVCWLSKEPFSQHKLHPTDWWMVNNADRQRGFTQAHTRTRKHCREFHLAAVTHCELTEPAHCLYLFFLHTQRSQREGDLGRRLCGFYLSSSGFHSHHLLGSLPLMMLVSEHWFQLHLFTKPVSQTTFCCRVVRVSSAAEAGSLSVTAGSCGEFVPAKSFRPRWPLLRRAVVLMGQCQHYMHIHTAIRCWADVSLLFRWKVD